MSHEVRSILFDARSDVFTRYNNERWMYDKLNILCNKCLFEPDEFSNKDIIDLRDAFIANNRPVIQDWWDVNITRIQAAVQRRKVK